MLLYLFLLFTVVPMVELALLLALHERMGLASTIALVIATGVLGTTLARHQGLDVAWRIRRCLEQGKAPTDALIDGALILVASAVLITPGILTDALGFALLIPPLRALVKLGLRRYFVSRVQIVGSWTEEPPAANPQPSVKGKIIDVQVEEVRAKEE